MQPSPSAQDAFVPPLPNTLPDAFDSGETGGEADRQGPAADLPIAAPILSRIRSVRAGCWLLSYAPTASPLTRYDGTMRVEAVPGGRTASGDLYQRPMAVISPFPLRTIPGAPPSPSAGIPIFARSRYRFYMRVTQILEQFTFGNSFQLGFQLHRFTPATGAWALDGTYTAQMTWIAAPAGYPSASSYLEGDVKNAAGAITGRLKMGWLSARLRKITVEIDAVSGCEQPLNNGAGTGWAQVFDTLNWEAAVAVSNTNVAEPSGAGWSDAEMHAAMLARRDAVSLDSSWHYHILAVKTIDSTPRGIMYDAGGTDSNKVPREGVGISTNWTIPNTAEWGLVKGQRFGAAPAPFFRTAVHELGHALGLYHNTVDNGFMNTTDVIAASATPATPFPNNIVWAYAPDDLKRLRHYPDVYVRPGGTAFGTASSAAPPITPTDEEMEVPNLELRVIPLLGETPIGAPVRVRLELVNIGRDVIETPASLSLKSEFVRGWVSDSAGAVRSFMPLMRCLEEHPMRALGAGESVTADLTLLRGGQGALFPSSGLFTITAEVRWEAGNAEAIVRGEASLLVTGAENPAHAAAAHKVLATPDAHLVLVLGGDHLHEGMEAIQAAVGDGVLAPHYAVIEAKRVAGLKRRGVKGQANQDRVDRLVDENSVMSESEVVKLAQLVRANTKEAERGAVRAALKRQVERHHLTDAAAAIVDAL